MAPSDEAVDDVEAVQDDGGPAAKDLLLDKVLGRDSINSRKSSGTSYQNVTI